MATKIEIKEYNGKKLEVTYTIDQQISGSEEILVKKLFPSGFDGKKPFIDTVIMNEKEVMDEYITLKGVVIGLTNKIHIISLTPADKALFESLDELPMCIEFTVDPGVNLSKIPRINNQEYKAEMCPICHENLFTTEKGGVVVGLGPQGCGHKFHRDCLRMAFEHSDKCPICRRTITGVHAVAVHRIGDSDGKPNGGKRRKTRKGRKSRKSRKSRKGGKKGKKSRRK